MSTAVPMQRVAEVSPRPSARITGVVYLLYFLTAVLGEYFLKGMVVSGDAAATANNILAHQPLYGLSYGAFDTRERRHRIRGIRIVDQLREVDRRSTVRLRRQIIHGRWTSTADRYQCLYRGRGSCYPAQRTRQWTAFDHLSPVYEI
jgi:hypothetical protein